MMQILDEKEGKPRRYVYCQFSVFWDGASRNRGQSEFSDGPYTEFAGVLDNMKECIDHDLTDSLDLEVDELECNSSMTRH